MGGFRVQKASQASPTYHCIWRTRQQQENTWMVKTVLYGSVGEKMTDRDSIDSDIWETVAAHRPTWRRTSRGAEDRNFYVQLST